MVLILKKRKITPYIYGAVLLLWNSVNTLVYGPINITQPTSFLQLFLVSGLAIVYFLIDFFCINMITNKVILLDILYYFKGKIRYSSFALSFIIAIQEEVLFRYYFFQQEVFSPSLLLVLGSLFFGAVHIIFSKYDVYSKTILGFICGGVFLITNSIILSIIFHLIYNYLTLKDKTTRTEVTYIEN